MMRIPVITAAMTVHTLPRTRASSVIAFVSISMNPAPRKKHGPLSPRPEPTASRRTSRTATPKSSSTMTA